MKKLAVPLDGSSFALQALGPALEIVDRTGGSLELVHVCDPEMLDPGLADVELSLEQGVRRYLEEVRDEILETRDIPVEVRVPTGSIVDALVEEVGKRAVDLAVLSTHGKGPLSRIWMGSVADRFVRRAPCPVLSVRPSDEPEPSGLEARFELDHVLVPLDGSEIGDTVLEHAAELARLFEARLTLFGVVWLPQHVSAEYLPHAEWVDRDALMEDRAESARARLAEVRGRLEARDLEADVVVVKEAHPAEAILHHTHAEGVDLVAMGTRGRGGVGRALLGSVADKVFRGSRVPVLLVRPPE